MRVHLAIVHVLLRSMAGQQLGMPGAEPGAVPGELRAQAAAALILGGDATVSISMGLRA